VLRPRVPRGLRALTAPAPSSRSGSYVMAGHVAVEQPTSGVLSESGMATAPFAFVRAQIGE
jgi:hypothetical protein